MDRPLQILIVEDNPDDAALSLAELRRADYDPQWRRVETEAEYLAALQHPPDLILSDYSLPEFNGLEAVRLLRQQGLDIPFILISGTVGEDAAVEAMQLGATDYLLKDRLVRLGSAVERALREARERRERKKAEQQIALQSRALEASANAIVITDRKGEILSANPAFCSMTGYAVEEVLGRNPRFLKSGVHPREFYRQMWETISSGQIWRGEITNQRKNGELYGEDMTITPVREADGEITHFIAVKLDTTERKKLEQQFLRAQRMESIGTLAGGIAHDLNNVLGPIMLSLELLTLRFPDAASQELLSIVSSSAQRGADMVRQVLSFARGIEGRRIEVQVRHLIQDIEKITSDTFLKNIQIRTSIPHDLWTVLGDPTQLHQVLLNLCVNARDAMPNGGQLTFSAENLTLDAHYATLNLEAQPGPYVSIQVEDTGTGMPPEVMEKIFDPFFTTKEIGKGTGLGLSTSLAIVKSHGGFLRVYSEQGKGTKFKVYLPAQTDVSPADVLAVGAQLPRGHGELILVIDDEPSVREITQQTLEAFGYRVLAAADGAEALSIFAARHAEIALVLTDMMMPVMDGTATIQVLRRINPAVRVIAASGLSANEHVASLEVRHFLPKPYTAEKLLKTIREALEEK